MNILVTGRPGVGKSTAIKRFVDLIGRTNVGGFSSQEIRCDGKRVGFSINTFSGSTGVLAHIELHQGPSVGKYTVNIQDIEEVAIPSLEQAIADDRIIIIDEIAKMELRSTKFAPIVRKCLMTKKVVGTIQRRVGTFVDEIRGRPDVILLELALKNRDEIPSKIVEILDAFN